LHERYDELKMLEFSLFSLKTRSIALLLNSFLRKIEKITLFLLSPYSRAKVSNHYQKEVLKMKSVQLLFAWVIISVGLVACGGGSSSTNIIAYNEGNLRSSELLVSYSNKGIIIPNADVKYNAKVYRLVYKTKNTDGNLIDASGLVAIPQKSPELKSPTILFHHGTIYENKYAPTESYSKASSWVLPAYLGFITVAPDYIGYGESQGVLHPYANAKITASTSIDLLRAAKILLAKENIQSNGQLFLGGYSQGGGAAIATQKMIETDFPNEFTVTATSAGAGNYAISTELKRQVQLVANDYETATIARPSNIGLIVKAMDEAYKLNMVNDLFKDPYASVVNSIYDASHNSTYIDEKLTYKASDLFKLDYVQKLLNDEKPTVNNAFEDNDVYNWKPKAPTRLFHGVDDDWVPYEQSQIAYDAMTANGATDVQLINCETVGKIPTNHANCFIPYLFSSYDFFLRYANDL